MENGGCCATKSSLELGPPHAGSAAVPKQSLQLHFLVAEGEPFEAREKRRASVGRSSGETYIARLCSLAGDATCDRVTPSDVGSAIPNAQALAQYDAVFVTGSPLHLYRDAPEIRRQIDFMRAVFDSGTPCFGSCAGLQLATVAAGGQVRPNRGGREAGFARRITLTREGQVHSLLNGRPASYDAPTLHGDEVEALPECALVLATNAITRVQAAEIRHSNGIFWGVQYHPELSLAEVAGALRREAYELIEAGLVVSQNDVESYAG